MDNFELGRQYFLDGLDLISRGDFDGAESKFISSLDLVPNRISTLTNLAVAQLKLKKYSTAKVTSEKAIALDSKNQEAYLNLGLVEQELRRYDEAINHYDKALALNSEYAEAWSNKGNVLQELRRYDEAINHYDKALALKDNLDWLYGSFIHAKMKIGAWLNIQKAIKAIESQIQLGKRVIQPFPILSLTDNSSTHRQCAEIYIRERCPSNNCLGAIPISKKKKIRIGYFSPDFRSHPVSYLTAELFEFHDREVFEVFAISLRRFSNLDPVRARLENGFDHFIDAENMSDLEIAKLARKLEIDISIDLSGHTQFSRIGIFSYRASPIQVSWLGYPGTTGADFIDYIVADKVLIPDCDRQFYSEKIAYLPHAYMVDDSKRTKSSRIFSREECGIPENAFVFCCFNNDYKFNEHVIESWSRILNSALNSVLWISENNEVFKRNIQTEFLNRGVAPDKIIFAKRVDAMSDHLARISIANLFLDTFPYNAHTTAVDALRSGVPVLTIPGASFPSRVASSLLNTLDLQEMIVNSQLEYEVLAIKFANNPSLLNAVRSRLFVNYTKSPLANTSIFTKNLEAAYLKMYTRYHSDLSIENIYIN